MNDHEVDVDIGFVFDDEHTFTVTVHVKLAHLMAPRYDDTEIRSEALTFGE